MLKKLFAVILVAFFVFGGSAQPALALDPTIPPCTIQVRSNRAANFAPGKVTVYPGDSLVFQVSNLINLHALSSAYSNDQYYVAGTRSGTEVSDTKSWVYILNEQAAGGTVTLEKPIDHFTFARNDVLNRYPSRLIVRLDPSVGEFSPGHETYCISQQEIEFLNTQRASCTIDAVVTKNDSGTEYYIGFSAGMKDFQDASSYRVGLWHGGFHPANFPNPNMLIPSNFFSRNSDGLFDGTITSANAPNRSIWTLSHDKVGKTGTLAINGPRYDQLVCETKLDFENASVGLPPVIDIPNPDTPIAAFTLCGQLQDGSPQKLACESCAAPDANGNPTRIYSAIGCIPIDEKGFLRQMIQVLLSVSGLIALLSILAGAFLLSTSQGDANQVKKAKEFITAAVSGLLFIIFSTIILDFIGVQILRIPGLS